MKHFILTLLLFGFVLPIKAQHDNIWYFGQWAGLDFSSGNPVALTDNPFSALEGTTVQSDVDGNYLFCTAGLSVYNKNLEIMENGLGLFGDSSTSQAAITVPRPGMPGRYYIFYPDAEGGAEGLHYSEVDMAGDGGEGTVVLKNVALVTPVCEKLAAVQHANGTDFWVIVHHWGSDTFYSYLVTEEGVNPVPVISNSGAITEGASNSGRYAGWLAISPNGSRLAMANNGINVELFDYDASTGIVSNPIVLASDAGCYGIEFSATGNFLYVTSGNALYQYQTDVADIPASETLIANLATTAAIKIGPDSKIYVVANSMDVDLAVINNPDAAGSACNFVDGQADLGGRRVIFGLPNFLVSPFYLLGIQADGHCTGTAIAFSVSATLTPESVEWHFGDGTTSSEITPLHTYTEAGTFLVKAKAVRGMFVRYFSEEITVHQSPVASEPQSLRACGNAEGYASFDLRQQDAVIKGPTQQVDFGVTYHATVEDAQAGINHLPDNYTNITNPQTIYARVVPDAGDCYAFTSFELIVYPEPEIIMPDKAVFCEDGSVVLSAPPGFDSYSWSTGEATPTITVDEAGAYTVTVTENNDGIFCTSSATIDVTMSGKPVIHEVTCDDWTDERNSITVTVSGNGYYEYSLDGITYQDNPVFTNLLPGAYTVYVRDRNGCGLTMEEVALLMYPRFFTPNGDGDNEIWRIRFGHHEPGLLVHIFDRYGKIITSFSGGQTGWDGTLNGQALPATDYWFVAIREDGREHRGHFSMIR